MRKSRIVLAMLTLAIGLAASLGTASATNCGTGAEDAHDRFGSCESKSSGIVRCGTGQDAAGVATVIAKSDSPAGNSGTTGVQACAEPADSFPIAGRVGAYRNNADGSVTVFVDGGETSKNPQGAKGWQRYDVRPGEQDKLVCARRGTGGTYYTSSGATSPPDGSVNHAVGTGGPKACQ